MQSILKKHLSEHRFRELFVEELGWDNANNCIEFQVADRPFTYQVIAHKRGFAILAGLQHRTVLADRYLLRKIQKQILRRYHEHIVIHFSDNPLKQVWQWAICTSDGRRLRHREHPFFSHDVPEALLARVSTLCFSLAEEDSITLVDALNRVRMVLDCPNDKDLFAKRPWHARRSDELAMAMQRNELGAFERFVEFHMPLAQESSRMISRWFENADRDDAIQIAMIGLIQAARRFKPDYGLQFSTYASYWIRNSCQRYAPNCELPIRLPINVFWQCYSARFNLHRLIATHGPTDAESIFARQIAKEGLSPEHWRGFNASLETRTFTDIEDDEFRETRRQIDSTQRQAIKILQEREDCVLLQNAIRELPERQAYILELRYGIGCPEYTLEEIGETLKVSRERVRQIQSKAEKKLLLKLAKFEMEFFDSIAVKVSNEPIEDEVTSNASPIEPDHVLATT